MLDSGGGQQLSGGRAVWVTMEAPHRPDVGLRQALWWVASCAPCRGPVWLHEEV